MIYLLSPSYLEWMLLNTDHYIGSIEFLESLKVINPYGNQGYIAHMAEIDRSEFESNWIKDVNFEDMKFSGYQHFSFSLNALGANEEKVMMQNWVNAREVIAENKREYFIFYPSISLESEKIDLMPIGFSESSKKIQIIKFQTNNDTNKINFLPNLPELIVTSFFMDDWRIKGREMEMLIKNKKTISGKIKNGRIEI